MNEIVCKSMIVQDNIKGEINLYYTEKYVPKSALTTLQKYILDEQKRKLKGVDPISIFNYFSKLVNKGIIPKRYMPINKIIANKSFYHFTLNPGTKFEKHKIIRKKCQLDATLKIIKKKFLVNKVDYTINKITYKEEVISLLIQKNCDIEIINALARMVEHDKGISFKEYIDNWAKRLINEMNIGGNQDGSKMETLVSKQGSVR